MGDKYIQEAVYRSQLRMSHGYMLGGKKEKQWWELENELEGDLKNGRKEEKN